MIPSDSHSSIGSRQQSQINKNRAFRQKERYTDKTNNKPRPLGAGYILKKNDYFPLIMKLDLRPGERVIWENGPLQNDGWWLVLLMSFIIFLAVFSSPLSYSPLNIFGLILFGLALLIFDLIWGLFGDSYVVTNMRAMKLNRREIMTEVDLKAPGLTVYLMPNEYKPTWWYWLYGDDEEDEDPRQRRKRRATKTRRMSYVRLWFVVDGDLRLNIYVGDAAEWVATRLAVMGIKVVRHPVV